MDLLASQYMCNSQMQVTSSSCQIISLHPLWHSEADETFCAAALRYTPQHHPHVPAPHPLRASAARRGAKLWMSATSKRSRFEKDAYKAAQSSINLSSNRLAQSFPWHQERGEATTTVSSSCRPMNFKSHAPIEDNGIRNALR